MRRQKTQIYCLIYNLIKTADLFDGLFYHDKNTFGVEETFSKPLVRVLIALGGITPPTIEYGID